MSPHYNNDTQYSEIAVYHGTCSVSYSRLLVCIVCFKFKHFW